jgi:tRNA (guanine-N7-)-methyltransferase
MRTNSPKNLKRSSNEKWETEGLLLPDDLAETPVDASDLFPDRPDAPLEIEVGIGKGTFLLARAAQRPEINMLGIEYARPYAAYTADRIRRAGLTNAKVLAVDAVAFLRDCLGDASVFRLHVYFPDPWPKRRHRRRRSIQVPFVENARRILQPGGQLLLVTDHQDYFTQMLTVLNAVPGFATIDFPQMLESDEHVVGTNFEKKYVREGRNVYKAARMKYGQTGAVG